MDGQFSVFINATDSASTESVGLYQYDERPDGTYTASAWFYPIEGQAHIGIAWRHGLSMAFSAPTEELNRWFFLEVTTEEYWGIEGGPLLYSVDNNMGKFYVDGVWLTNLNILILQSLWINLANLQLNPLTRSNPGYFILLFFEIYGISDLDMIVVGLFNTSFWSHRPEHVT